MIHLYLVRHGAAEDAAPGSPDALRTLTAKARRRFRRAARSLARRSGALDLVLTSPLVRAVQTAEILAGEVKHGALSVLPELGPDHDVAAVLKAVSRARKDGSIALVGHEPQIGRLLAALARLSPAQAGKLDIRPGAIVRVDVSGLPQAKEAEVRWWIKAGPRRKGLPWKKEPAPARQKTATKKAATPPPVKKQAVKKPAEKPRKAVAKPRKAVAPKEAPANPPRAENRPAAPKLPPAAPRPTPAGPPPLQRFMGSPRPKLPPASPEAAPPAPPTPEKPPSDGSPSS